MNLSDIEILFAFYIYDERLKWMRQLL